MLVSPLGKSSEPYYRRDRASGRSGGADDQGILCDAGILEGWWKDPGVHHKRPLVQDWVSAFEFSLSLYLNIIQDSSPTVLNDSVCSVIWYSDIASLDGYGYCKIEGRIKDLIIRGGENIYPAEIEQFLHTHPKIQEAQVNNSNQIHLYWYCSHQLFIYLKQCDHFHWVFLLPFYVKEGKMVLLFLSCFPVQINILKSRQICFRSKIRNINTFTSQKLLNSMIFNFFFCTPSLHLFDPNYSKNSKSLKYFYYLK